MMVTISNGIWSMDIRQIWFGSMFDGYDYDYTGAHLKAYTGNGFDYDFGGHGFKYHHVFDPKLGFINVPTEGTVTSYTEIVQGYFSFRIAGLNIDMADMAAVAKTPSSSDDQQLIQQAMSGQDTYKGGVGDSYMATFNGDDILIGGGGADTLFGGKGADTFVYKRFTDSNADRLDSLMDFSRSDHDKINLSAIDANRKTKGDAAFDFIGTHVLDHHAGELHVFHDEDNTYVGGDVNGDGKDDLVIVLYGHVHLTQQSFEL
jgi:Ca2+-binding RTX toxin-like protein